MTYPAGEYQALPDRIVFPVLVGPGTTIEVTQFALFDVRLIDYDSRERQMRGMWGGDKPTNSEYKPAIDGFGSVDGTTLRDAIVAAISDGAAVQFSCTRDFGAVVVTLLNGNDKLKVYPTNAQEIAQCLEDLRDSFTKQPPKAGKSK